MREVMGLFRQDDGGRRTRIVPLGYVVIVIVLIGIIELLAYLTSFYLAKNARGLYLPCITQSFQSYSTLINPVLGWPTPNYISTTPSYFDETGSRLNPAFPDPRKNKTCISLYGDSYTEGEGVSHREAWSGVLAELLGCRVANYGMRGYGSDQAYLRYSYNHQDKAKIVILSHMSQNIMRNINQLRNFIAPSPLCIMKPRFILNKEGGLELVPIAKLSDNDYKNLEKHPERYLEHDFYIPDGLSGCKMASFPYSISIIKAARIIIQRLLLETCPWENLYKPGHPSQAFEVTVAIMKNFHKEALNRGQYPIIFILPNIHDMRMYQLNKYYFYQPLIDILREQNIEVVNIGNKFFKYLQQNDQSILFSEEIQYHYSVYGNRMLARIAADYLEEKNIWNRRQNILIEP